MNDQQRAAVLADAFGRASKSVVRALDERLGDQGVSTPRSKLLAEIERLQPVRSAELARAVGITQATASSLVEALVREGLVARSVDERDRRAVQLRTTTDGSAQARRWLADYTGAAADVFGGLTPKEQELLTGLLNKLSDALAE